MDDKFKIDEYLKKDMSELERMVTIDMYNKGYDYMDVNQIVEFWDKEYGIKINERNIQFNG